MNILTLQSVSIDIGDVSVCKKLDLSVEAGRMLGVLGRNGVGKSTLLYTIMGFKKPAGGKVIFDGKQVQEYSARNLARRLGILFQDQHNELPATVMETALLGRHPHSDNLLWDTTEDLDAAREALDQMGLSGLEHRQISTLSGGEKQRLALAMLIVQAPQLYLLDEPSNHLDIDYQIKSLANLQEIMKRDKSAVIMASHDINLVARYCEQVLLLIGDGQYVFGDTADVLNQNSLSQAYRCPITAVQASDRHYFFPA